MVYLPPEITKTETSLFFWVDLLNWKSFTEIGEMNYGTTALCSRGHPLKDIPIRQIGLEWNFENGAKIHPMKLITYQTKYKNNWKTRSKMKKGKLIPF